MVVPAGMESVPLPLSVPPLHVIEAAVRLMFADPPNVPPAIVRIGIDCADALLIAVVPPLTSTFVVIVPVNVFVPLCHTTVPEPPIVVAASNVRVSEVLKLSVVPALVVNVVEVALSAA